MMIDNKTVALYSRAIIGTPAPEDGSREAPAGGPRGVEGGGDWLQVTCETRDLRGNATPLKKQRVGCSMEAEGRDGWVRRGSHLASYSGKCLHRAQNDLGKCMGR
jgi:hypothetical protein